MKVRISQAVDLAEVPDKLSDIIYDVKEDYDSIQARIQDCIAACSMTSSSSTKYRLLAESILEMRSDLSQLDTTLSDLISIIEGYIGIIERGNTPAGSPMPPAPEPETQETKDANQG
tara:strand:- start:12 stop:362 length:351 start_codon:yes stop_codon:yes gene_type:complete